MILLSHTIDQTVDPLQVMREAKLCLLCEVISTRLRLEGLPSEWKFSRQLTRTQVRVPNFPVREPKSSTPYMWESDVHGIEPSKQQGTVYRDNEVGNELQRPKQCFWCRLGRSWKLSWFYQLFLRETRNYKPALATGVYFSIAHQTSQSLRKAE